MKNTILIFLFVQIISPLLQAQTLQEDLFTLMQKHQSKELEDQKFYEHLKSLKQSAQDSWAAEQYVFLRDYLINSTSSEPSLRQLQKATEQLVSLSQADACLQDCVEGFQIRPSEKTMVKGFFPQDWPLIGSASSPLASPSVTSIDMDSHPETQATTAQSAAAVEIPSPSSSFLQKNGKWILGTAVAGAAMIFSPYKLVFSF